MSLYNFGSGTLFGTPNGGNMAANPTPLSFGTLQDVTVDISSDQKELFGQNQFAVDTARGKSKISWKAKFATLSGKLINDLYFAETLNTPMITVSLLEASVIVSTTVTVVKSATFVTDLGVTYVTTGNFFVKVASAPIAGQYSVAAGVYTFAAGDTGASVAISYKYTAAAATGTNFIVQNRPMGYSPTFSLVLSNLYQGNTFQLTLFACRAAKLALSTKNDDYTIPELDGMSFANAAGQVLAYDNSGQ